MPDVTVYTFSPDWDLPTTGPFALKLLAWLRLNEIPYRQKIENDARKGPAGKSPWAEIDGEIVGDSDRIIARLAGPGAVQPEQPAADRAAARAFKTAFEERFHQVLEYELFVHPEGVAYMDRFIRKMAPPVIGGAISRSMQKHFSRQLHARGIARHPPEEVADIGRAEVATLAAYLDSRGFLGGAAPSLADVSVFGQVAPMLAWPMDTPVANAVKETPALRRWAGDIRSRAFG